MDFKKEATVLAKQVIEEWIDNKDFDAAVAILEDYLTDQDTVFRGKLEQFKT